MSKDTKQKKRRESSSTEIPAETSTPASAPESVEVAKSAEQEPERKKQRRERSPPASSEPSVASTSAAVCNANMEDVGAEIVFHTEMKDVESDIIPLSADGPAVEAEPMRYFDFLPDFILKEILFNLDTVSQIRLSRVCRKWQTFLKKPAMLDELFVEQTALETIEERRLQQKKYPKSPPKPKIFPLNDWSGWVWRALADRPNYLQKAKRVVMKGRSDGSAYVRCASISPMTERSVGPSVLMECASVVGLRRLAHLHGDMYPTRKLALVLQNVNVDFVEFFNSLIETGLICSNLPMSMKDVVLHLNWKLLDLVVNIGIRIPEADIQFPEQANPPPGGLVIAVAGWPGWGGELDLVDMLDDQEPQNVDHVQEPAGLIGSFHNEMSIISANLGRTTVTRLPEVITKLLVSHCRTLSDAEIEKLKDKLAVMFRLGKKGSKVNPQVMQVLKRLWPALKPYVEPMDIDLTGFTTLSRFTQHALVALTDPHVFFDNWRVHKKHCTKRWCEHRLLHGSSLELKSTASSEL